jgi:four helix bundle protein
MEAAQYSNPKIQRLEDFQVWQEARRLRLIIDELVILRLPKGEEYNLKKHLNECTRNLPGNIAEGFGRKYSRDCMQFYRVANGSLNEIKNDLYLSFDRGYIDGVTLNRTLARWEAVSRLLAGVMNSVSKVKPLAR